MSFLVLKKVNGVFYLHLASPPPHRGCFLPVRYHDKCAIRASGLIPVIPLTTINKDTQLPMCIEEQAINY